MGNVNLGRGQLRRQKTTKLNLVISTPVLFPPDPARCVLVVCTQASGQLQLQLPDGTGNFISFYLQTSTVPFKMTVEEFGDAVTGPFQIMTTSATAAASVLEIFDTQMNPFKPSEEFNGQLASR